MLDAEKMLLALQAKEANLQRYFEPLREENAAVLRDLGISPEAQAFFAQFSFDTEMAAGEFTFMQANCLKKNRDWDEEFKRALQTNLLLVGSGLSGDMVVIDLLDYQAGILFHDYFWEEPIQDPRKYLIKMECSLGQFYWNSVSVENYPIDAYEAAAYMGSEFTGYKDFELLGSNFLARIFQIKRQRILNIFLHFLHGFTLGEHAGNLFQLANQLGLALANEQGEFHKKDKLMA